MTALARWAGLAALLLLGIAAAVRSLAYGIWVDGEPGPGLFPLVAGALVALPCLFAAFETARRAGAPAAADDVPRTPRRLAAYVLVVLAWPVLFQPLGYAISSSLALLVLLRVGGVSWPLTAAVTAGAIGGSLLLFQRLLEVPLPKGSWG